MQPTATTLGLASTFNFRDAEIMETLSMNQLNSTMWLRSPWLQKARVSVNSRRSQMSHFSFLFEVNA